MGVRWMHIARQMARFHWIRRYTTFFAQRQRALNSDYKSIFPRAEADVYITTDSASVVVDK